MHMTTSPTLKRKREGVERSEITKKEYNSLAGSPPYASTTPGSETFLTHFSAITHASHSLYSPFHRPGDDLPKYPSQDALPPKKRLKPLKSTKSKAMTFIDLSGVTNAAADQQRKLF
ncbi:MAG: hypothetical protein M1824_004891 [Vezdaea acicularis]|nr:MAG: hypothetical protein M1824_004891 [Vezdaea acicularis]